MFSLNFMFLCSLIEELCTKEENDKTSCNFNFRHECIKPYVLCITIRRSLLILVSVGLILLFTGVKEGNLKHYSL